MVNKRIKSLYKVKWRNILTKEVYDYVYVLAYNKEDASKRSMEYCYEYMSDYHPDVDISDVMNIPTRIKLTKERLKIVTKKMEYNGRTILK